MANILIPRLLQDFTDQQEKLSFPGKTLGEVIDKFIQAYPEVLPFFDTKGDRLPLVTLHLEDANIRFFDGRNTPLSDTDTLSIIPVGVSI